MKNRKIIAMTAAAVLAAMTITGCGKSVDVNATFATLDDTKITMGIANLYVKYQQSVYDLNYLPYFGENMWTQDLYGTGSTMENDVKTQAAEQLQEMYLLKAHMKDYEITLTEEENKAIDEAVTAFMDNNSKEALKQMGATSSEYVKEMLELQTIRSKMHEKMIAEADTTVTDEEAAQRTISYVKLSTAGKYDEESNYIEYTDEEKEGFKKQAEEIAAADNFDTAVTDAGLTVETASYGSAKDEDASLDTAVLEAADGLNEGSVSGVIETEEAYFVVRLDSAHDETASQEKKEKLMSQKEEDHYNDILDGWKEKAKWELNEKEWSKISFKDHFASEKDTESLEGTESIAK